MAVIYGHTVLTLTCMFIAVCLQTPNVNSTQQLKIHCIRLRGHDFSICHIVYAMTEVFSPF